MVFIIFWVLLIIVLDIAGISWVLRRVHNREENERKNIEIKEQILEQIKNQNRQSEHVNDGGQQDKVSVCPYSNLEEAMKDARQGNPDAQYWVGEIYDEGLGRTPCSKREAALWMMRSAEQGNDKAQCELGLYYLDGTGVEQDEKEGVKWLTESANRGNGKAQYTLGECYQQGRGVMFKDEDAAKAWFSKAKDQGYSKDSEKKPRMNSHMGAAKHCPNCGQPIKEGEKFCRNCGASLPSTDGTERAGTGEKQRTDQTQNHARMNSETTAGVGQSQKTYSHKSIYIAALVLGVILALVIGIFIGRRMGSESETTHIEGIEEPAEESEAVEETPGIYEEQSGNAGEEAEQEEKQQDTNVTYSWSVNDGLELTTLEVVSVLEDSTLHATFTNNTRESIVIGWASTAQIDIRDVNGNEYYAHVPAHTEIYASESTKLDLEVSGKIEAEIAEIKVEGVYYVGSNGLPTNTAGSTATYTVDN